MRYCLVAGLGLAVNYAVYSACVAIAPGLGVPVIPAILPLFVAAGSGVAMVLTFVGFRSFAFRGLNALADSGQAARSAP